MTKKEMFNNLLKNVGIVNEGSICHYNSGELYESMIISELTLFKNAYEGDMDDIASRKKYSRKLHSDLYLPMIDLFSTFKPPLIVEETFKGKDGYQSGKSRHFYHFHTFAKEDRKERLADEIKLYIPVKFDAIGEVTKYIIQFLLDNKIEGYAKFSEVDRTDSLVVRVMNLEDARKLVDFINNSKEIVKYSKEAIPSCMSEGIVSLAKDCSESYNAHISELVYEYIRLKKFKEEDVNVDEFIQFVEAKLLDTEDKPYNKDIKILFLKVLEGVTGFDNFENIVTTELNIPSKKIVK